MNETYNINDEWLRLLENELATENFKHIHDTLYHAYQNKLIYPPHDLIFNAFNLCPLKLLKIVLIGQDPYHGPGQAHGLSFSVRKGVPIPPSLKNIFKELHEDIPSFEVPVHGDLSNWAKQGVLLLNTVMTVEAGLPGSHKNIGWEGFTNNLISLLSREMENLVFMLWGNYALQKATLIDENKHLILKSAHPSPLARGAFFGCKHFSKSNHFLINKGKIPVDWRLKESDLLFTIS